MCIWTQTIKCHSYSVMGEGGLSQPLAMSVSLRLWLLLRAFSVPTRSSRLALSPSCFSSERGRNQKGMLEMSRRADDTRKPIHQAPTQRASLGVMVTLSGWWERASEWVYSRKTKCLMFNLSFSWMSLLQCEGPRFYVGKTGKFHWIMGHSIL